jgi:hypothetical protein
VSDGFDFIGPDRTALRPAGIVMIYPRDDSITPIGSISVPVTTTVGTKAVGAFDTDISRDVVITQLNAVRLDLSSLKKLVARIVRDR